MQSWSYVNGGKGLASNEMISPSDSVAKTKNAFIGWDLETANSSSFGNTFENQGIGDLSSEKMNPFMDTFSLEANSNSRHSCSAVNSNKRASSYIDLKLGRFGDPEETRDSRISKERSIFSVSESSKPAKRVRLGVNFQHSRCQVYGCNKDLTSSKEYHRRHKVCEVHSKTSKVIVNGIEQRFCQQCSRFHLLKEFDDGKRSCRKRLAGHNERRRKPQVGIHSGRTGRLVQSYNGFGTSRYNGTSLTSFICEDILPNVPLQLEKSGRQNWYRNIKVEDCSNFSLQSSIPITNGHLNSKPVFDSSNLDKAFLGFHVNEAATPTGTAIFNESPNRYTCNLAGSNEEFDGFDSVQGLSGITNSSCALSLLSSQLLLGSNSHYSVSEVSEKLLGVSSTSGMSNKGNHFGSSALISNGFDDVINFDGPDGFCQGSNFKDQDDTTIDLLELSSQLQRVEWQKQSMQVKQENDAMYWRHVT